MDKLSEQIKKRGFEKVWVSDLGNGTFRNPVIYADYSDPDIVKVGEDFYMVASSFGCLPGLPLLHSKDLVNWKIINNIVDRLPFDVYDKPQYGKGIWAPSIRYHDGKTWVFFSTPDEGIFMTNTEDPYGKWSELTCVKEVKGWIDPCPFWDEDGKAYLVHAFAGSRAGFNSILNVCKMSSDGTRLLDEGQAVFDGNETEHHTIEGPKMYKRNGYYYIFAPAGGVPQGWQVILRSKNIYGPYEDKIVLHQGTTITNGPHQGGYVELENGESWFLHFQDRGAYGRIIHLQPVDWLEDWPMMGEDINNDHIGEPVSHYKKPLVGKSHQIKVPQTSDDFNDTKLGLQWQWNANYKEQWYSLTERKDFIRLFAVNDLLKGGNTLYDAPNLLLQKYPAERFTITTKLEFTPKTEGIKAGVIVSGTQCYSLAVYKKDEKIRLGFLRSFGKYDGRFETEEAGIDIDAKEIYLRVDVGISARCSFSYSFDGKEFVKLGYKFNATTTLWMGSKIGIFCVNTNEKDSKEYADFDWFLVEEK